jgi:2-dehydropantoate 2-reductase
VAGEAWPQVAVLGAGAVGCWFGGMLARAGAPVTLIGRLAHVAAMQENGLLLDSVHFRDHVAVAAATEASAARGADIVLLCVKTLDTESAGRTVAPWLEPDATVVSLQNGVDNIERLRAAAGIDALPAVVYVAAAMAGPGHVRHTGRGDLVVGEALRPDGSRPAADRAERVAALFTRAGVPCRVSERIETELWAKLAMNCAWNAISALTRTRYGELLQRTEAREIIRAATLETAAVAGAAGITLPGEELVAAAFRLGEAMPHAVSSTAQDIERGRPTEIDALNGYVAARGAALGVATPVNHTLHALVRLIEPGRNREEGIP